MYVYQMGIFSWPVVFGLIQYWQCLSFSIQDLYIGANVQFHKHKFILIDADEYAVDYMEKHANEFPQANIKYILPRLRRILDTKYEEVKAEFGKQDPNGAGKISFSSFLWVRLDLLDINVLYAKYCNNQLQKRLGTKFVYIFVNLCTVYFISQIPHPLTQCWQSFVPAHWSICSWSALRRGKGVVLLRGGADENWREKGDVKTTFASDQSCQRLC